MFAFFQFLAFFAEEAHDAAAHGGTDWYTYFNYPGFEAWKFLNLFVFLGVLIYILRKPLSDAFKSKRETIRQELIKAQRERDAALAKLGEVEARLANLQTEAETVRANAEAEAEAEALRIAAQTRAEVEKLRDNARREIEAAAASAKRELKRFSADESIKLAEETLRQNLKGEDASRLVAASINGLNANQNGGQN